MSRFSGERLQALREACGLTQEQLANEMRVSRSLITQLETGRQIPSMRQLLLLCDILKAPIGALFEEEDSESEDVQVVRTLWKRIPHERRQLALRILRAVANFRPPDEETATLLAAS